MNRVQTLILERADKIGTWRECVYDSLPPKQRALIALAHPLRWARVVKHRVDAYATLPGDVWQDFQRDIFYLVRSVKPSEVVVLPVSGQVLWMANGGHDLGGCVVEVESFPRDAVRGWVDTRPGDADAVRELAARVLR